MENTVWPLFVNLLLAHLLADFPLQPDFVFRQKSKGWHGVMLHASVFLVASVLLLLPMLMRRSGFVLLLALTVFHFWVDESKLRLFRRREVDNLWVFLADQAMHFTSLLLGAMLFSVHAKNSHMDPSVFQFTLGTNAAIVLTGLVISSYFGVLITHYIEKMFLGRRYVADNLKVDVKYYGILGRLAVTAAFLADRWLPLTLTSSLAFLFFLSWRVKGWGLSLLVFYLSSAILASLVGMFLWL